MSVIIDTERGKKVADLLYRVFSTKGIHGKTEMPEDIIPKGVEKGSIDHILFITLTVSIDYQRDATLLWESSRKTFEDTETKYLFVPKLLYETSIEKIILDMQKYKLSKKIKKDANIWWTIGVTFYKRWQGNPFKFLEYCDWDAENVLKHLKYDFPYLRGPKISSLWLRMLRDNVGIQLKNLEKIPIPVDIHIARATLTTGVIRGKFIDKFNKIFEHIRKAWFESVKGLRLKDREMIPLDIDEPLWILSKYGCRNRNEITGDCLLYERCEAKEYCVKGMVKIKDGILELETQ
ncbi:MAG: hypothetical protein ABDH25_06430 [Dictyoglomaceae bacterium]